MRYRHETWGGMQWTRLVSSDERCRTRTAKACGPDIPTLISSLPRRWSCRRRWQESPVAGESALYAVKTIARETPGGLAEPVVTLLVCFLHFARGAAGAAQASGVSCALFLRGRDVSCTTRARRRRGSAEACVFLTRGVIRGLDPRIHPFAKGFSCRKDRCPDQVRSSPGM